MPLLHLLHMRVKECNTCINQKHYKSIEKLIYKEVIKINNNDLTNLIVSYIHTLSLSLNHSLTAEIKILVYNQSTFQHSSLEHANITFR